MAVVRARVRIPAGSAGKRALVVVAVLFGLFLMHGVSATADADCGGLAASPSGTGAVVGTAVMASAAESEATPPGGAVLGDQGCACDEDMAACTPLPARNSGVLLGALLLALGCIPALLSGPVGRVSTADRSVRRARVPISVLDLTCVSRT
jgi:hypothetical protein